jgi:uracil-DNA glycosylase family 4
MEFNPSCRRCPRLFHYLNSLRKRFPDYHNAPVPRVGDPSAQLMIVGLAPGLHGANATGRVFTGDASGDLLFATLHRFGFCSHASSRLLSKEMRLDNCIITNAVKCVPPSNRPNRTELKRCGDYLRSEIEQLRPRVIVALGRIAHDSVLKALRQTAARFHFAHRAEHRPLADETPVLLDSYHCSRYNVQTKRLTVEMFDSVFVRARELLDAFEQQQ